MNEEMGCCTQVFSTQDMVSEKNHEFHSYTVSVLFTSQQICDWQGLPSKSDILHYIKMHHISLALNNLGKCPIAHSEVVKCGHSCNLNIGLEINVFLQTQK